jgi:hypothetical protein
MSSRLLLPQRTNASTPQSRDHRNSPSKCRPCTPTVQSTYKSNLHRIKLVNRAFPACQRANITPTKANSSTPPSPEITETHQKWQPNQYPPCTPTAQSTYKSDLHQIKLVYRAFHTRHRTNITPMINSTLTDPHPPSTQKLSKTFIQTPKIYIYGE